MEALTNYIFTFLIACIPAVIAYFAQRRVNTADVATKYQALAAKQAADNEELEKCQDALERQVDELKAALRLKDTRIMTLEARVTELETESAQKDSKIKTLQEEIDALQRRRK